MGKYRYLLYLLVACGVIWGMKREAPREFTPPAMTEIPTTAAATEAPAVEFPYVLRDTGLIAEGLAGYEGPFPEDGSSEEGAPVADAAALMVMNPGKEGVLSALVTITQGEETLRFYLTYLPPGGRVLVVEKDGKRFSRERVTDCRCLLLDRSFGESAPDIPVTETETGLRVENRTEQTVTVTVYYKSYYAPDRFYLGGQTRSVTLKELRPGETREFLPPHYAPGSSRVVWTRQEAPAQ